MDLALVLFGFRHTLALDVQLFRYRNSPFETGGSHQSAKAMKK